MSSLAFLSRQFFFLLLCVPASAASSPFFEHLSSSQKSLDYSHTRLHCSRNGPIFHPLCFCVEHTFSEKPLNISSPYNPILFHFLRHESMFIMTNSCLLVCFFLCLHWSESPKRAEDMFVSLVHPQCLPT